MPAWWRCCLIHRPTLWWIKALRPAGRHGAMDQRTLFILGAALVSTTLFLGGQLIVSLTLVLNLVGPVPAAYVHMRQGPLSGVAVIALSCAALLLLLPPVLTLGFLLQYGVVAFFVPLFLRRGLGWDRALAATVAVGVALAVLLLTAAAQSRGVGPAELVRHEGQQVIQQALAHYDHGQMAESDRQALEETLQTMAEVFVLIYPAVAVVLLAILGGVVILLLQRLAKHHYRVPGVPFYQWKAPDFLVWALIAAGFALMLKDSALKTLALNVLVILLPVYFFQGMAIIAHYLRRKAVAPVFRPLVYVLIFVLNPLPMFVTAMGVFDIWFDFRKPRIQKTS